MSFLRASSPHAHKAVTTARVMQWVLLATLPGLAALTLFFGYGSLINVVIASVCALGFEAAVLSIRHRRVSYHLKDCSALVTAFLLALALPPYCPWWLVVVGVFFAIVIAKQLYGGLGFNPFNPAMVAYVVLLISFPLEMSQWASPTTGLLADSSSMPSVMSSLSHIFGFHSLDGYTAATPLDILRQNSGLTLDALYQQESAFNSAKWAGHGWEWVNIAFLCGGIVLLYKKIFTWHAPVAMLATLVACSVLFYDSGSSNSPGSPVLHLLSGATMLGAFFILTDPVSSAVSNKGRLVFGAGAGLIVFVIRAWGNYPDAMAFAILLMNFAAPFIDYYTVPRSYGHANSHDKSQRTTDTHVK